MKTYLAKLAADYDRVLEFLGTEAGEAAVKKISGKLKPGASCAWCFEDDVDMWKRIGDGVPPPEQWPFSGFIVPFPDTNGRSEMEIEHVCVVVVDYPIEKENPETDWVVLACILEIPNLHQFVILDRK